MDPISLIVTALVGGATAAAKETASDAVKAAYRGLKELVQSRFAGKPEAEMVLAQTEKKPEVWQEPLKDALTEERAGDDRRLIEAAQKIMSLISPQQAAAGKYNVQISGNVQGLAQGDHQRIRMNFNEKRG